MANPIQSANANRAVTIPAINAYEEIHSIEEIAPAQFTAGSIRVTVRTVDMNGVLLPGMHFKQYVIKDADYQRLVGPVTPDMPGKPAGTYRNQDLWLFIDQQRSKGAV